MEGERVQRGSTVRRRSESIQILSRLREDGVFNGRRSVRVPVKACIRLIRRGTYRVSKKKKKKKSW
jgi:hypothetical protein